MTAQQLKNSILQMAVQGKLVPQDPNDEPASVLIERIRAEKEKLIKEKKIKKEKNPSVIFRGADNIPYEKIGDEVVPLDVPFDIPDSWEWARWGTISESIQYGYNAPALSQGRIKMVRISDIQENSVLWDSVPFCDIKESDIDTYILRPNDILFARTGGTVGKSYLVKEVPVDAVYAGYLIRTRYSNSLCPEYLKYFMESELYWSQLREGTIATAQPNCNGQTLGQMLIPVPPQNEQKRIVEKLNLLMPYIQQYVISHLSVSKLDRVFPEQLKKSILQCAVQGKLVPQDENDEPAEVLLERIRAEKDALIKAGKIKRDKHESVIFRRDNSHYEKLDGIERCIDDEIPFEIPDNWCWSRLGSILTKLSDGTHSTPKYVSEGVPFISVKDVSTGALSFEHCKYITQEEHKDLYSRCDPQFGDVLLTKVGTTGIPVIVDTDEEFSLFVSVALLKFNQNLLFNEYLVHLINSPLVQKQAEENTRGVGNKNWVMRDISNTLVAIPPLNEQKRIVKQINYLFGYFNHL